MSEAVASQFELVAYLVPGYLVILSILYAFSPETLRLDQQRIGAGAVLASAIAALLAGVTVHRVSAIAPTVMRVIYREPALLGIVRRYQHLPAAQRVVSQQLKMAKIDPIDTYYYARIIVGEKAPQSARAAEHLMTMSLLCRDMLVALPLSIAAVFWRWRRAIRRKILALTVAAAVVVLLELLFIKGYLIYWTAAVWRVLRAVLVFQ